MEVSLIEGVPHMRFINVSTDYFQEALDIAIDSYKKQCQHLMIQSILMPEAF